MVAQHQSTWECLRSTETSPRRLEPAEGSPVLRCSERRGWGESNTPNEHLPQRGEGCQIPQSPRLPLLVLHRFPPHGAGVAWGWGGWVEHAPRKVMEVKLTTLSFASHRFPVWARLRGLGGELQLPMNFGASTIFITRHFNS